MTHNHATYQARRDFVQGLLREKLNLEVVPSTYESSYCADRQINILIVHIRRKLKSAMFCTKPNGPLHITTLSITSDLTAKYEHR